MKIDLATIDGTSDTDIGLQDGDVVRVETRDPHPISVIGLVQKPGQYDMPVGQPVHVLDALPWQANAATLGPTRSTSQGMSQVKMNLL